ncbi:LIM and senescent cell antigen -containing domain protein 1 [Fasciola gigantica]|uniref:LIM and senescent cell antigen-containing domain protein 1 n=1 Tax=Fasciola gigantica TaxID=46835 RepID=A0A504YNC0_FASGI|nr:LIM and senescent cell antigen -containing domain protein 1 [Fasciola gigantica]
MSSPSGHSSKEMQHTNPINNYLARDKQFPGPPSIQLCPIEIGSSTSHLLNRRLMNQNPEEHKRQAQQKRKEKLPTPPPASSSPSQVKHYQWQQQQQPQPQPQPQPQQNQSESDKHEDEFGIPSDELNAEVVCSHCKGPFKPEEDIVACKDKFFHQSCFVCAQCFRPLSHTEFYEYEGRRYCKYDFQMLFAPFCSKCGEFIMARVIKAMGRSWHPQCLVCDRCGTQLGSTGLQKIRGRPYCRSCFVEVAQHQMGQQICQACRCPISPNELIRFKGDPYHPHHFQCALCDSELGPDARERDGDLYCLRCFDKMGIPICSACRRPIEGRIVWALGRTWHVEHFVCHHCELPFMGGRFYEWRGHAYCLTHYQSRIGNVCHICNKAVTGVLARFTNKAYCPIHFTCSTCDTQLNEKSKLYEIDLKPVCKDCYERFPTHWKRRLAKLHLTETPK